MSKAPRPRRMAPEVGLGQLSAQFLGDFSHKSQ